MDAPRAEALVSGLRRGLKARGRLVDRVVFFLLLGCAAISIATTIGIVGSLLVETISFFQQVSIVEFLTSTKWTPLFASKRFGILPLLWGTLYIALGAAVVGLPVGLLSAVFLSEYAPSALRRVLKPCLEILAGVPSVVYGYFALTFITPVLKSIFPEVDVFNAASAFITIGIMIIPLVSSLSEDALHAVPWSLREAAYALGSTKHEVTTKVVIPSAISGIVASFILAVSRAIGETMVVVIAAGQVPNLTLNPFKPMETMTAYIVQVSLGDTPYGSLEYKTIFSVGMTLFALTFVMNLLSHWVVRRFKRL